MSLLRRAERCFANHETYKSLNAFIKPPDDKTLRQQCLCDAEDAEERRAKGQAKSDIDGHLIAIKDNICTARTPTTCASGILEGFYSPYLATVVQKLQAAGAVIAGKANLDEFGMGSDSINSKYGAVRNVHVQDGESLSAGGSSGGSAVAVATSQCDAALGTDSGGSVRLPAAYTGIIGFKPSYGIVSRWGVVAYANSLDTVGILTKKSDMAKRIYELIKGYDPRDPTSLPPSARLRIKEMSRSRTLKDEIDGSPRLRIGVPDEYNTEELQPSVREAWLSTLDKLQNQGHSVHTISLPATRMALSAYYVLAPAEASSNLAKYDGVRYGKKSERQVGTDGVLYASTRGAAFGAEVKRRILLGSYSLSATAINNYFIKAQRVRRLVQEDFNKAFAQPHPLLGNRLEPSGPTKVDVILTPTAVSLPPKFSSLHDRDPVDAYSADVLTVPASLAGLPAISVPVSKTIGMQVLAQYGDDELVLRVAEEIESFTSSRLSPNDA